jgi:GR25 family glycosyltransferase involved in LPS biosynthesis
VFDQIREAQPPRLYIVADGPREEVEGEAEVCQSTRAVTENIDWDCEISRNYAPENYGIKKRFVTGLSWLFEQEPEAIILEDDCVPNQDFFRFCETMLDRYRNDKRVWDVTGTNYLETWKPQVNDYHFSHIGGIWGWATWRRSWEEYDPELVLWEKDEIKDRLRDVLGDDALAAYAETVYSRTYQGMVETWDYQWGFAKQINSGLSVVPAGNLVSNIGFGSQATNTTHEDRSLANVPTHSLVFPLQEPPCVAVDRGYDMEYLRTRTSLWERIPSLRRLTNRVVLRFN